MSIPESLSAPDGVVMEGELLVEDGALEEFGSEFVLLLTSSSILTDCHRLRHLLFSSM